MDLWNLLGAGVLGLWIGGMLALSRLPEASLSRTLRAFALCAAYWALGDIIASGADDMLWKQVGLALLYTGSIFVPPLWWRLALRRARELDLVPRLEGPIWEAVPLGFAGLMWLGMLTNPWHGLFITPVLNGRNVYGPLWFVTALPSYALICGVFALEVRVMRRVRGRTVRRQAAFMILASGLTLVANILYVSGSTGRLNTTLPVLGVSGAVLVVGMWREGLFGVLPFALPVIASHDPDGLLVVRPDGRLIHANPRARTLLSPVVLVEGLPFLGSLGRRLWHADGRALADAGPGWEGSWWRSALQQGGATYQYGEDGECWLRMSAQPVYGRGKKLLAHCLRVHDASEEQRTQAALRRARSLESVAEVALGVAHDFNNLLVVMRGNAEMLTQRLGNAPHVERKLHRILRSLDQATELSRQLQVCAGAAEPRCTKVDLAAVAKEALEVFDPELDVENGGRRRGVRVRRDLHPATLEADPTQLRQLVQNLLDNARDSLGEAGGDVYIETSSAEITPSLLPHLVLGEDRPAGEFGYVRVSDDGAGMAPDLQERIFEPFFSTKGKQRGIGLATVFGIARSHGALLQLESTLGHGTVFTVYFPVSPQG